MSIQFLTEASSNATVESNLGRVILRFQTDLGNFRVISVFLLKLIADVGKEFLRASFLAIASDHSESGEKGVVGELLLQSERQIHGLSLIFSAVVVAYGSIVFLTKHFILF